MKASKKHYHYAVRRTQNNLKNIENDKVVSKMGSTAMFEEIKKSCRDKNTDTTSVIDDVHGASNIMNNSTMNKGT